MKIQYRRVTVFLVATFAFTWSIDLLIWLGGGFADSPAFAGGPTAATLLLIVSMLGPALGVVLARRLTGEGWKDHRIALTGPFWCWLLALLAPAFFSVLGAATYFLVFPGQFDITMPVLARQLSELEAFTGKPAPLDPRSLAALQLFAVMTLAPFINAVPALGEELGWRGYLQWKLRPLGWTRALLTVNVIWSIWHWPAIAMGHNYGFDYAGGPWTGFAVMTAFTVGAGSLLGWVVERTGSVLPAALGHGAINATAGMGVLFLALGATPSALIGPMATGLLGGGGFLVAGSWALFHAPAPARSRGQKERRPPVGD